MTKKGEKKVFMKRGDNLRSSRLMSFIQDYGRLNIQFCTKSVSLSLMHALAYPKAILTTSSKTLYLHCITKSNVQLLLY